MNPRSRCRRPPATRVLRAIALLALGALPLGNAARCWAFDHARDPVLETATGRPWTPADGRPARVTIPDLVRTHLSSAARTASSTPAPQGDDFWWDGFALPDIDGWVNCAIEYQGSLVIGGRFTQIDGVALNNIARWDGTGWSSIGAGFDSDVLSLAVYGGQLVASGSFFRSGDQLLNGIGRWDGAHWNPLGSGLVHASYYPTGAWDLAVSSNLLYATGEFDQAGDVPASFIARWDGSSWSSLGSGLDASGHALCVSNDSLYVGGPFHSAGGVPASSVAVWDGQAWSALGSGISAASGYPDVYAMTKYHGLLVTAGYFDSAGSAPATGVAAWDGSNWHSLGDPSSNGIYIGASLLSQGDTLIVGGYGLTQWDGSAWSYRPPSASGFVSALVPTPYGLCVAGSFIGYSSGGRIDAVNIGLVRDNSWSDLATWSDRTHGLGGIYFSSIGAMTSYRGALTVGGTFMYAGTPGGRTGLGPVAQWNGESWSTLGYPLYGQMSCMLSVDDTLYVGGLFPSGPWPSFSPVARFDGTAWSLMDTVAVTTIQLARYRGKLYACGGRSFTGQRGGVFRWDGQRWETIATLDTAQAWASVNTMIEFDGRLVVGGDFRSIGGVDAQGFASWDGHTWSAMDTGLYGARPVSMAECDGVLYASGDFLLPRNRTRMVRWEGGHWSATPSPQGAPYALQCVDHSLLAGGYLLDESNVLRGIMRWNGTDWRALGSGTNGLVRAMQVVDHQLYVGGDFSRAGGRSSASIARWDLGAENRVASMLTLEGGVPNPFTISTSIAFRLVAPGRARVTVFDLRGRRILTLEDATRPAGTHIVTWNGQSDDGGPVPAGIYFVRVDTPGHSETRRIARLR